MAHCSMSLYIGDWHFNIVVFTDKRKYVGELQQLALCATFAKFMYYDIQLH
jgi:hypothetical protein